MKIKIEGIRRHENSSFKFKDGITTLLKGVNGAGKTTLIQCIYWCLFGKSHNLYDGKCSVEMEFKYIGKIVRKSSPNKLILTTLDNKTLLDGEAQEIINNIFGDFSTYKMCCWIQQQNRCYLLSAPNNIAKNILLSFTYQGNTSKNVLNKIKDTIQEKKELLKEAQIKYETS